MTTKQKYYPQLIRVMDVFGSREKSQAAISIMKSNATYACYQSTEARDYRKQCLNAPCDFMTKLIALNQLAALGGVVWLYRSHFGKVLPDCERVHYLRRGSDELTVIYWRGKFRVQSLNTFLATLKRANVNFTTGAP